MSVKLVLRKVPNEPNKSYLFIRTILNRKSRLKSLGIKINSENLKKSGEGVKSVEPDYQKINKIIDEELKLIKKDGDLASISNREAKKKSVLKFIDKVIENTANQGTVSSRISAKRVFQNFLEAKGKEDITFSQITPDFIDSYNVWLLRNDYKKNTANQYLQTLQLFINYAKKDSKMNLPESYNPFNRFKFKRNPVKNKALSKEELSKLVNADFKKQSYSLYRDMFMFQLYGGGLRVSDALILSWDNIYVSEDGEIVLEYTAFKTNKPMVANLYTNALEYLNSAINRHNPVFVQTVSKMKGLMLKLDEAIEELETEIKRLEDAHLDPIIVLQMVKQDKADIDLTIERLIDIRETRKKREHLVKLAESTFEQMLGHYKIEIKKLHRDHSEELIFPFLWDKAKGKPAINLKNELMNAKDYGKLINERSKFVNHLKRIQKDLKIKTSISSHSARHSFTQLLMESNVNTHYISMSLGHNSIGTTELYRRTLQNKDSMKINDLLPTFKD